MKKKIRKKKINRRRRGLKTEKLAFKVLQEKNFLVWKPPRVKFYSQDILGFFDLIALKGKELKLIQVQKERKRPYKIREILKLPKPSKVSYELWVYNSKEKKFDIYPLK